MYQYINTQENDNVCKFATLQDEIDANDGTITCEPGKNEYTKLYAQQVATVGDCCYVPGEPLGQFKLELIDADYR